MSYGVGTLGRVEVAHGASGGDVDEQESPVGGGWVGDGDGLARRLKALACTRPLHELDARKSRLDWLDGSVYQMAEIGFQAIDLVTIAMDFDHGVSHDQVAARLVPFIAAQAPDRDTGEYERVARRVLDSLINVGSLDRGFRAVISSRATDGFCIRPGHMRQVPTSGTTAFLRQSWASLFRQSLTR